MKITIFSGAVVIFSCAACFAQKKAEPILNPVGEPFDVRQEYIEPQQITWMDKSKVYEDHLPEQFFWNVVLLNQIGFDIDEPKRFTSPLSKDGSPFIVRKLKDPKVLFKGTIKNNIGDFSDFKPKDGDDEYVVVVAGSDLKTGASDPFLIKKDAYKKFFHQNAVDFLIDVRSIGGTHPSAYGGGPWRDGGKECDFTIPALILFFLANEDEVLSMPRQIDWDADKARILSPDFPYMEQKWAGPEVLERARKYYDTVPAPKKDAPDVVKLIHWGVGYSITMMREDMETFQKLGQTMEQLSYFLWAEPKLGEWIPKEMFAEVRAALFGNWYKTRLADMMWYWNAKFYSDINETDQKKLVPVSGGKAQGHTIVPNLLMHEVAKRMGKPNSQMYLDAAVKQAQWIIDNVDWKNPLTTKGHRFDEHRTITNLVWLLKAYPDAAPEGLEKKIDEWVDIMISRSNNMWDYRMLSPEHNIWTVPVMNDVGSLLNFGAIGTAAGWALKDPAKKKRLQEITFAQIDAIWGRNPRMCAGVSAPDMGWEKWVERGWPLVYKKDVCARLELCRGSISTSCGSEAYPFAPKAKYRHVEGWVMYGSVWATSLSYIEFDRTGKRPWDMIK